MDRTITEKNLVSIVVPIYNAEKYLQACIKSLLHQTYTNIEIILVNDGSKDSSLAICQNAAKKDKRIVVITQKNQGVSMARNSGIKAATGQYIMFCDSDDVVHEDWVKLLVLCIGESGQLGVCRFVRFSKMNGDLIFYISTNNEPRDIWSLYHDTLLTSIFNKIYRKDIISASVVRFKENLMCGEDLLFNLDYIRCIKGDIMYNDSVLYGYRDTNGSLTDQYIENMWEQKKYQMKRLKQQIDESDIDFESIEKDYYSEYIDVIQRCLTNNRRKKSVKAFKKNVAIMHSEETRQALQNGQIRYGNWIYNRILRSRCYSAYMVYMWLTKLIYGIRRLVIQSGEEGVM